MEGKQKTNKHHHAEGLHCRDHAIGFTAINECDCDASMHDAIRFTVVM